MIALLGHVALLIGWLSAADGQTSSGEALRELSDEVSVLAARVAEVRATGGSRATLAAALAAYREKAERRDAMLAEAEAAARDAERRARLDAGARLGEAVARATSDPDARGVLVAWLGEPSTRLDALEAAWSDGAANPLIGQAFRLDVEEQAALAGLVAAYDASEADRAAKRARNQAAAIRARARTGTPLSLESVAEAERLERDAAAAESARYLALATAARASALRDRVRGGTP